MRNTLLKHYGIDVPNSLCFQSAPSAVILNIGTSPFFIKPNRSGSSFGVSRIESLEEFSKAFGAGKEEGNEVIVEEGINGIEVGCGVLQSCFDFENSKDAIVAQDSGHRHY